MAHPIRAIVFDQDGVLIPSDDWHYAALNDALISVGLPEISRQKHLGEYSGWTTRAKLLDMKLSPEDIAAIESYKLKKVQEIIEHELSKGPPLRLVRLFKWLRDQKMSVAICSNSGREVIKIVAEKLGVPVSFYVSREDVEHPKPAPDVYRRAAELFGLHPRQILVLEDHPTGIKAAQAAGCHVFEILDIEEVNLENVQNVLQTLRQQYEKGRPDGNPLSIS